MIGHIVRSIVAIVNEQLLSDIDCVILSKELLNHVNDFSLCARFELLEIDNHPLRII